MVRGHAAWALGQLGPRLNGDEGRVALRELMDREQDAWVRSEAEAALGRLAEQSAEAVAAR